MSLTGAQAGIRSTRVFSSARITDIHPERISAELRQGKVVIVTGFQGVTEDQDITTLGRGGSDTTAVALAVSVMVTLFASTVLAKVVPPDCVTVS